MSASPQRTLAESADDELVDDEPSFADPVSGPLRSGLNVGRYVVLYRLGEGGMGLVYAAYDPRLDRKLALKVVRPRASRDRTEDARVRRRQRLLAEAQTLAKLSHPNVVAIHDVGLHETPDPADPDAPRPLLFVAMDFVQGEPLDRWLAAMPRRKRDVIRVFTAVGRGLAAAHAAGIVHRDFKPQNVIVGPDERPQVLDFGLAHVHSGAGGTTGDGPDGLARAPAVAPGRVGTPGYMAPEQILGEPVGPAADQFSFCVALYEALYRTAPFAGADSKTLAMNVTAGHLREPQKDSRVPVYLQRVVTRGLSSEAERRFPSMDALLAALARRPKTRTKVVVAGAAVSAAVVSAGLVYSATASEPVCAPKSEALAATWAPEVRTDIEATFGRSTRTHAPATAARVLEALDDYVDAWNAQRVEACEATHVRHEQSELLLDARVLCLSRQLEAFDALAQVLRTGGDETVDRALLAIDGLPAATDCRTPRIDNPATALPADPWVRDQIATVDGRLREAEALHSAGQVREARRLAEATAELAASMDFPPSSVAAHLLLGRILVADAAYREAHDALLIAVETAEAEGLDTEIADARIDLVGVSGDRLGKLDEAHLWARLARASLERLRGDASREARLEDELALVLRAESRPEDVLAHQRRALQLAQSNPDYSELSMASHYNNLAQTLSDLGRHDEALGYVEDAEEIWTRRLGAEHPRLAIASSTRGLIFDEMGAHEEALEQYEAAYQHTVRVYGRESAQADEMLTNVAIGAATLGDLGRARAAFEGIIALRLALYGDADPRVASARHNLGAALRLAGDPQGALREHRSALAIREKVYGTDHPQVVGSLSGIANALETAERWNEALDYRRRALAIRIKVYGERHLELVQPLANLAHNEMLVGNTSEALVTAERALSLALTAEVGIDVRAYTRIVAARVLAQRGEDPGRVRTLVAAATEELGELPAVAERALLEDIARIQAGEE